MRWGHGKDNLKQVDYLENHIAPTARNAISQRIVEEIIPIATEWMQGSASWKDRTGDARRSLTAWLSKRAKLGITVFFGYHPKFVRGKGYYWWYLENMQNGRFAILRRAEDYFMPRIRAIVKSMQINYTTFQGLAAMQESFLEEIGLPSEFGGSRINLRRAKTLGKLR